MLQKIRKFFSDKGQGVVEYALLLGFVAVITVALVNDGGLKDTFKGTLSGIMHQFTQFNDDFEGGG